MTKKILTKDKAAKATRNAAIYAEYAAMMRAGSMKMPIYERLAKKYSLSVYFVGKIIRAMRKEVTQ